MKVNKIRVTLTISLQLWTFIQHIDSHNIQSWKTIRTPQLHIGIGTRENCWRSLIFAEIGVAVMHNRVKIVGHISRILLIFFKLRFFPCKSKIEHFFLCRCAKWTKDVSLVRSNKSFPVASKRAGIFLQYAINAVCIQSLHLPAWIFFDSMMTCSSLSKRLCSCKKPILCITSCIALPRVSQPTPRDNCCLPPRRPIWDQHLYQKGTVIYRNYYYFVS